MSTTLARVGAVAAAVVGGAMLFNGHLSASNTENIRLPAPRIDMTSPATSRDQSIVFAGGCFWGIQAVFEHVRGVKTAVSGYAGGSMVAPSYEDVSSGTTGHAESVQVVFDATQVSLGKLLEVFFSVAHDPTQQNRQGPDVGTQYRSAVFYQNDEQHKVVDAYIAQLTGAKVFSRPIVTQVAALRAFYPAESYHQHYATLHPDSPYIATYDLPKVAALRERFPTLYREEVSAR